MSKITSSTNRSGILYKNKVYVPTLFGNLTVYDTSGKVLKTIAPTEGYKIWTGCNIDAAGHLLVRVDKTTATSFGATGGVISTGDGHGFMVIDTNTDEVIHPFLPLDAPTPTASLSRKYRFDAMAPVAKDIFTEEVIGVYQQPMDSVHYYRFLYNNRGVAAKPNVWKWARKATIETATSTAYLMEYAHIDDAYFSILIYSNPHYEKTYSAAGKKGNSIHRYTSGYQPLDYYYTPQHSGLTGFNCFRLDGKDYIIYPATQKVGSGMPADAFAISEVRYVDSPTTDMTMPGENLVDGALAGTLKARVYGATSANGGVLYSGTSACVPSYTIEPVEGDDKSVYISVYNTGAPANKWKFTVSEPSKEAPLYMISKKAGAEWNVGAGLAGDLMTNIEGTKTHVLRDAAFAAGESLIGFSRYTGNFNSVNLDRFGPSEANAELAAGPMPLVKTFADSYLFNTTGATNLSFVADMGANTLSVYTPADLLPAETLYMHGTFYDRHFDFGWPVELACNNPSDEQQVYTATGILLEAAEGSDKAYFVLSSDKAEGAASRVAPGAMSKPEIEAALADANIGHVYETKSATDAQADLYPRIAGVDTKDAQLTEVTPGYYDLTATFSPDGNHTLNFDYKGTTTGIGNVDAEASDVPAVYYNLQGLPVATPEHGIYIKVQGDKATKVKL
ncbi:MAG: hypothetical protein NC418_07750 [Muribaculaceae bacterium]|nr:hypothetical protein [Muribaculaceae bacterium]